MRLRAGDSRRRSWQGCARRAARHVDALLLMSPPDVPTPRVPAPRGYVLRRVRCRGQRVGRGGAASAAQLLGGETMPQVPSRHREERRVRPHHVPQGGGRLRRRVLLALLSRLQWAGWHSGGRQLSACQHLPVQLLKMAGSDGLDIGSSGRGSMAQQWRGLLAVADALHPCSVLLYLGSHLSSVNGRVSSTRGGSRGGGGGSTGTGHARATAGRSSGQAVPGAEGVTFASGSGGKRMEKGRGAAAAGQPLYIRAGRLSDPPFGGHLRSGNSLTREPFRALI